jgi:hypothetical protein
MACAAEFSPRGAENPVRLSTYATDTTSGNSLLLSAKTRSVDRDARQSFEKRTARGHTHCSFVNMEEQ